MFTNHPWLPFVLPLAVFMAIGALEPTPPTPGQPAAGWVAYEHYPLVYTLKIALTAIALVVALPAWRQFPLRRVSRLAVALGLAGGAVWIVLALGQYEATVLGALGLDQLLGLGQRSAYNPLEQLADRPVWKYGFLAVRLFGLVVVIALAEELLLRGFLMRWITDPDAWQTLDLGQVRGAGLAVGTLVPMLMHPAELLAAAVWFSAVTWLMLRTRNLWDCIVAHGLTNLTIGLFVLWRDTPDAWRLL
jgi:uncharacterized protein